MGSGPWDTGLLVPSWQKNSLSTRVSAFISLALVVVLVLHNNNFTISNFNRIKLYLTQISILKLDQVNLDQLLILDGIKLFWILIIKYYFVLNMTEENIYDSVVMTYFFFTLWNSANCVESLYNVRRLWLLLHYFCRQFCDVC